MLGGFIANKVRYDIVAFAGLMVLVVAGIVPPHKAFVGFASPAVITVICVMILTYSINQSGLIDWVVRTIIPSPKNPRNYILALCFITAFLSAFMNNVGALALMMPVAISSSKKEGLPISLVLMPLAFSSVLGGMTTVIGTPPNLLISAYRQKAIGHPFQMFDYTPVGLTVALVCVFFIGLFGWWFLPKERESAPLDENAFDIKGYITEIKISEDSDVVDKSLKDFNEMVKADVAVLGIIRGKRKKLVVQDDEILNAKDILIIEASPDELKAVLKLNGLELLEYDQSAQELLMAGNISLVEAVVPQGARIEGRSWQRMRLKSRFRMNLIAISREGKAFKNRLQHVNIQAGDVLLVQGDTNLLTEQLIQIGTLPLVGRNVTVDIHKKAFYPVIIFVLAVLSAGLGFLPIQIAFCSAIILIILLKLIPLHLVYRQVDWSIIVLLASMIPIGQALQSTGATEIFSRQLLLIAGNAHPIYIIGLLLFLTMTISDLMNNAATAVVMAPIAVSVAQQLHLSVDPFLMSVAIGASCSFLTPVSHQNNTLVMGPGGYRFFDYVRLGLPTEILVLIIATPMIMYVWPV